MNLSSLLKLDLVSMVNVSCVVNYAITAIYERGGENARGNTAV